MKQNVFYVANLKVSQVHLHYAVKSFKSTTTLYDLTLETLNINAA